MSLILLQRSFLEAPSKITEFYYDQVMPRLNKRSKVIAISAAVVLICYKITDMLKPPKHLRHIPYQNYFGHFVSILKRDSALERAQKFSFHLINSQDSNGLFLRNGGSGWRLLVTNPDAIKKVLLKTDLFPKVTGEQKFPDTLLYRFIGRPNILSSNGEQWKEQRKIANPAFHRSMPVGMFGQLTLDLFSEMDKLGDTIEMTDFMERWTLDAIGKAGFDFNFDSIADGNNEWVTVYHGFRGGFGQPLFVLFPKLESHLWLFPKRKAIHRQLDRFLGMIDSIIEEKRRKIQTGDNQNESLEENEKDLLTLMLESERKGEGKMTNEELQSNLCVFFVAGHDTTANALSFALYHLAVHPDIQQRAREEVVRILGDEKQDIAPTVEDTKQMNYINQVIKEVLRINCPVNNTQIRYAAEDCELAGTFVPKGTHLMVNIFDTQHCEKYWPDPLEFNPDRFNTDGTQNASQNMTWIPFGNGARQCIGMNFSLAEQRVILSMLLRRYMWTLPENSIHKDGLKSRGLGISSPLELEIKFTKRY